MSRMAQQVALLPAPPPAPHLPWSDAVASQAQVVNAVRLPSVAVGDAAAVSLQEEDALYASGQGFAEGQTVTRSPLGVLPADLDSEQQVEPDIARRFDPRELADVLKRECPLRYR
jgi:hypothetical protein